MLHNEIDSYIKEILFYYLNGELDSIISKFKAKAKEQLPDHIYDSSQSITYHHTPVSYSGYSDPTGERAIKIADFYLERERQVGQYIDIKNNIERVLDSLEHRDIIILKAYLEINTFKEAAAELKTYQSKLRRQALKLVSIINQKTRQRRVKSI